MKPILFSTPMVQAILAGQKTMTRRVIRNEVVDRFILGDDGRLLGSYREGMAEAYPTIDDAPYQEGDVLWVRETWNEVFKPDGKKHAHFIYKQEDPQIKHWRPSIFMPKSAARIFLRVIDVRAERLQDITVEDVIVEGLQCDNDVNNPDPQTHESILNWNLLYAQFVFQQLWDHLNAARGYGWDKNPWVWVYEFERITREEAEKQ